MFENEKWIRDTVRSNWKLGIRPDTNDIIGLYRSESYANEKYNQNSSAGFGNVDLTLTGALGKGIVISGFNKEYEVFSTDSKYNDIVEKYGDWNFNITEEQKTELFNRIQLVVLTKMINRTYE